MSCLAKVARDRPQSINEILRVLASLEKPEHTRKVKQDSYALIPTTTASPELEQKTKADLRASLSNDEIARAISWPKINQLPILCFLSPFKAMGRFYQRYG